MVDVLAIGAHPDDVELGIGGLIHKLTQGGATVAVLDLTRGEMSSRGTPEERHEEAQEAARILGVSERRSAELPDSGVANTPKQRLEVIHAVRAFRPRVLLAPMRNDRHPDHHAAHDLVRDANYFAGLHTIDDGQEPYRTPNAYYYHPYFEDTVTPQLIIDISGHFEAKLAALRAHASQFHNPDYDGANTYISSERFWESITTRAAYWGSRINAQYGEALSTLGPIGLTTLPGFGGAPCA